MKKELIDFFNTDLQFIKGVGPVLATRFEDILGGRRVIDFMLHKPSYVRARGITDNIQDVQPGESLTIALQINQLQNGDLRLQLPDLGGGTCHLDQTDHHQHRQQNGDGVSGDGKGIKCDGSALLRSLVLGQLCLLLLLFELGGGGTECVVTHIAFCVFACHGASLLYLGIG